MYRIFLSGLALILFAGCGLWGDPPSRLWIVGVDDDGLYYQYHKRYTGYNAMPSSLWKLAFDTETTDRVRKATRQFGAQAEGDYYVTELVQDNETKGKIIAVQISSGDSTTLYERSLEPASSDATIHALSDGRVVVLTELGLVVHTLGDEGVTRTVSVPLDTYELAAFSGDLVVVLTGEKYGDVTPVLIDLGDDTQTEIPPAPGNEQPHYLNVLLDATSMVVNRRETVDDNLDRHEVLRYDFVSKTWTVVAQFASYDSEATFPDSLFLRGYDGTRVVVTYHHPNGLVVDSSIESIDVATGSRNTITDTASPIDAAWPSPMLRDDHLYWIEETTSTLVIYDLETDEHRVLALELPD